MARIRGGGAGAARGRRLWWVVWCLAPSVASLTAPPTIRRGLTVTCERRRTPPPQPVHQAIAGLEKKQLLLDAAIERARTAKRDELKKGVLKLEAEKKDSTVSLSAFLSSTDPAIFNAYARTAQSVMRTQAMVGGVAALLFSAIVVPRRRWAWPASPFPGIVTLALALGAQLLCERLKRAVMRRAVAPTWRDPRELFSQKHVASFTREPRRTAAAAPACALAAASASLAEETVFRGALLHAVALVTNRPALAAALVAPVFGAVHVMNIKNGEGKLDYAADATGFGLILGAASFLTEGGLVVPVLAHFAYNFLRAMACLREVRASTPSLSPLGDSSRVATATRFSMATRPPEQFDFGN